MPLTAAREVNRFVDQQIRLFGVAAAKSIFKGALVGRDDAGYSRPLIAGDVFLGIAYESSDNSTGANGALDGRVFTLGDFEHALAGATVGDIGRPVFASADDTLVFVGDPNSYVGVVQGIESAGVIVARVDAQRRLVKTISHAVENLAAGADVAARAIHAFGQPAWMVAARVVNQATAAVGIDAGDTCTVTLAIDAGTVVAEVFDDVTTFPGANAAKTLGALANQRANPGDVLTLAVLNGTAADPGPFVVEVDYV